MSDIFEEDVEEVIESEDIELDTEIPQGYIATLDARRRLESMLEEKRLRYELDDFVDY